MAAKHPHADVSALAKLLIRRSFIFNRVRQKLNPAPATKIPYVTNRSVINLVQSAFYSLAFVLLAVSVALTISVLLALIGAVAPFALKALLWTRCLAPPDRRLECLMGRNAVLAR